MAHELLRLSDEINEAFHQDQPIVALESSLMLDDTSCAHHLETIRLLEQLIRDEGAVPATIAIHQGMIHVGLSDNILHHLIETKDKTRASRRDMAYLLTRQLTASTSVSATMFCAHLASIPVFVTGGIGGVHHHANESFDVSSDLVELSTTPITVVCSGAKSILDLPKTLEMLETQGIPVIGYQTDEFPAFYSHSSGIPLPHRLDEVQDIAELMSYQRRLHLHNGIVIANPIPKAAEIPDDQIGPIIKQAQQEAQHIHGKSITPFLLQRIAELTAGQSVQANLELVKSNARLGAQIAVAYHKSKRG
jgi:pseudouridylate synthase